MNEYEIDSTHNQYRAWLTDTSTNKRQVWFPYILAFWR